MVAGVRWWWQTMVVLWAGLAGVALAEGDAPYQMPVLTDPGGSTTSLRAQAAGDRLLVVVMKGTWCPVCVDQLQRLAKLDLADAYSTRLIGLSTDGLDAIKVLQPSLPVALLTDDPRHTVVSGLGLWRSEWGYPLPSIVLFDRCGAEHGRWAGRNPGVSPDASVIAALEALVGSPEDCPQDDGLSDMGRSIDGGSHHTSDVVASSSGSGRREPGPLQGSLH